MHDSERILRKAHKHKKRQGYKYKQSVILKETALKVRTSPENTGGNVLAKYALFIYSFFHSFSFASNLSSGHCDGGGAYGNLKHKYLPFGLPSKREKLRRKDWELARHQCHCTCLSASICLSSTISSWHRPVTRASCVWWAAMTCSSVRLELFILWLSSVGQYCCFVDLLDLQKNDSEKYISAEIQTSSIKCRLCGLQQQRWWWWWY